MSNWIHLYSLWQIVTNSPISKTSPWDYLITYSTQDPLWMLKFAHAGNCFPFGCGDLFPSFCSNHHSHTHRMEIMNAKGEYAVVSPCCLWFSSMLITENSNEYSICKLNSISWLVCTGPKLVSLKHVMECWLLMPNLALCYGLSDLHVIRIISLSSHRFSLLHFPVKTWLSTEQELHTSTIIFFPLYFKFLLKMAYKLLLLLKILLRSQSSFALPLFCRFSLINRVWLFSLHNN